MSVSEVIKSTVVSADGAARAAEGYLWGLIISGAAGVVKLYDNASAASGTEIAEASGLGAYMFPNPVKCANGIYVDLTGNVVTVLHSD